MLKTDSRQCVWYVLIIRIELYVTLRLAVFLQTDVAMLPLGQILVFMEINFFICEKNEDCAAVWHCISFILPMKAACVCFLSFFVGHFPIILYL